MSTETQKVEVSWREKFIALAKEADMRFHERVASGECFDTGEPRHGPYADKTIRLREKRHD